MDEEERRRTRDALREALTAGEVWLQGNDDSVSEYTGFAEPLPATDEQVEAVIDRILELVERAHSHQH